MTSKRLELRSIGKGFPGVQALDDVSFTVDAGEIHGLVGENGAGKSTLMAIASGALAPDAGEVLIDGVPLPAGDPANARAKGLAIVRQEPSLMPDLSVAENLYLGASARRRPRHPARLRAWAEDALASWRPDHGIDPGARVSRLTTEQRFVVEIAKALSQRPKVLILDEPTEHLAGSDVDLLIGHIKDLAAAGCAVIYISHRIREVQRLVDRLTILRDGRDQGTHECASVSEAQVVDLIVGRPVDTAFPVKATIAAQAPVALELENFGGPGFSSANIAVRRGEILGLAGIDGNGQRELLRALGGLNASHGTVRVNGRPVRVHRPDQASNAGIVYVPSDRHREGILGDASVQENVALRTLGALARWGFVRPEREKHAGESAVRQLAIKTPTLNTPAGSLSGGNQQKVVLAGALAASPTVLLADEPTQGVDVGARMEIYAILRRRATDGMAVVVLASDALEIAGLCDRVLVFSRGRIATEIRGDQVTEHDITEAVLTTSTVREPHTSRRGLSVAWMDNDSTPLALVTAAILGLGVYAAMSNEFFLTTRNFQGIFALVATLSLAAAAQQMSMLIGGIDLSVGPLMGLIVVVESFFLTDISGPGQHALGWLLLIAVAVAVGVVNWALIEYAHMHAMVATLVTYMALQGVSLILRPTPDGLISTGVMDGIGHTFGVVPLTLLIAGVLVVGLHILLQSSRWGLNLRAYGSDAQAARAAGVRPKLTTLCAYVGCSTLAGAAAIPLIAQVGSGDPSAGTNYTLTSVAAAVIGGASLFGGRGSFLGCLLGALLIQQVASVTTFLQLTSAWQSYLLAGMILGAVAIYSKGRQLAEVAT
jgi:ribose transport system ATP-binding protein